jgi:hypothetical protein
MSETSGSQTSKNVKKAQEVVSRLKQEGAGGNVTTIPRGGNVTFSPGNGEVSGDIVFQMADGREMMRFDDDGKVYVRGEQVDDNQGIYMHFRRWLEIACIIPPRKDIVSEDRT